MKIKIGEDGLLVLSDPCYDEPCVVLPVRSGDWDVWKENACVVASLAGAHLRNYEAPWEGDQWEATSADVYADVAALSVYPLAAWRKLKQLPWGEVYPRQKAVDTELGGCTMMTGGDRSWHSYVFRDHGEIVGVSVVIPSWPVTLENARSCECEDCDHHGHECPESHDDDDDGECPCDSCERPSHCLCADCDPYTERLKEQWQDELESDTNQQRERLSGLDLEQWQGRTCSVVVAEDLIQVQVELA